MIIVESKLFHAINCSVEIPNEYAISLIVSPLSTVYVPDALAFLLALADESSSSSLSFFTKRFCRTSDALICFTFGVCFSDTVQGASTFFSDLTVASAPSDTINVEAITADAVTDMKIFLFDNRKIPFLFLDVHE